MNISRDDDEAGCKCPKVMGYEREFPFGRLRNAIRARSLELLVCKI